MSKAELVGLAKIGLGFAALLLGVKVGGDVANKFFSKAAA